MNIFRENFLLHKMIKFLQHKWRVDAERTQFIADGMTVTNQINVFIVTKVAWKFQSKRHCALYKLYSKWTRCLFSFIHTLWPIDIVDMTKWPKIMNIRRGNLLHLQNSQKYLQSSEDTSVLNGGHQCVSTFHFKIRAPRVYTWMLVTSFSAW